MEGFPRNLDSCTKIAQSDFVMLRRLETTIKRYAKSPSLPGLRWKDGIPTVRRGQPAGWRWSERVQKIDGDAFRKRFERHLSWVLSSGRGGERGDFRDLDLDGVNLHGYTLHGAAFGGASLRRAELRRAELREADLAGADLGGALLHDAVMTGASLRGARLVDAELVRADLTRADLSDADLAGADLLGAALEDANLDGADLTAALSLTARQIARARLTRRTQLPEGLTTLIT